MPAFIFLTNMDGQRFEAPTGAGGGVVFVSRQENVQLHYSFSWDRAVGQAAGWQGAD